MRVLLVEDDPELAAVLENGLAELGFHVVVETHVRRRRGARGRSARST